MDRQILFYVLTRWFARRHKEGALTKASFAGIYAVIVGAIPVWLFGVGGMDLSPTTLVIASAILLLSTFISAHVLSARFFVPEDGGR